MLTEAERLAIDAVMRRHEDGLRRLARQSERYIPVSRELREAVHGGKQTQATPDGVRPATASE